MASVAPETVSEARQSMNRFDFSFRKGVQETNTVIVVIASVGFINGLEMLQTLEGWALAFIAVIAVPASEPFSSPRGVERIPSQSGQPNGR